jgi:hypothetical protein
MNNSLGLRFIVSLVVDFINFILLGNLIVDVVFSD